MRRFAGLTRAHGTYALGSDLKADAKGKLTGPRRTVQEPVTAELWAKHLAGTYAIGVVPIREDSRASFGAIDIDVYDGLDLPALNRKVRGLGLPLIICRTKSGGAHLYLFLDEPAPAELVRGRLVEWAIALGYAGVEVFPKQVRLAREDDPVEAATGNWINMPYAQAKRTLRYALDPETGEALSAEAFLDLADREALPGAAELEAVEVAEDDVDELFRGGPPCLQALAKGAGFGDWQNNALFNFAVYLRKRYGDEGWAEHVDQYNRRFLDPPVQSKDVVSVIKSVSKKKYSYMCKQDPICRACDRTACRGREHGVGGMPDDAGVEFGPLTKIQFKPPVYIWEINKVRIELDSEALLNQRKLHKHILEELDVRAVMIKESTFSRIVSECLVTIGRIEVPEDATREGQLWVHLGRFCTGRATARDMDEILLGKPYADPKAETTYFQAADFLQYLQQHRVPGVTEREVWRFLRRRNAGHAFKVLKGKGVNLWTVPSFDTQRDGFQPPRVALPDRM